MKSPMRDGRVRKGVYLLPSLFTFGNLFLGFYACVRGLRGDYQTAAILIVIAGFLDTFDGRIARLTRTESAFGKEFDSLADVVTFGVVPALLAHIWGLQHYGRIGWLIPVFFLLCAATRLARFNVQSRTLDSRFFVGLPTPPAAAATASVFYFLPPGGSEPWTDALMMGTLILNGSLMVSTFRYLSFKQLDLTRRWSYRNAVLLGVFVLLVAYNPPGVLFSAAVAYVLSGPVGWLVTRALRKPVDSEGLDTDKRPRW